MLLKHGARPRVNEVGTFFRAEQDRECQSPRDSANSANLKRGGLSLADGTPGPQEEKEFKRIPE